MSVSGMLVSGLLPSVVLSKPKSPPSVWVGGGGKGKGVVGGGGMVVECSSRPQKKATAHHRKTRPKKTQPWDVKRRGPTPYPELPPLPPDWTLASSQDPPPQEQQQELATAASSSSSSPPT